MANPFLGNLETLNQLGFFNFLFPFLLALAISFGALEFALGGGTDKAKRVLPKSATALISIIIAFFVMNYTGGIGSSVVIFFSKLFGQGMIVAVVILMIAILLGLFGIRPSDLQEKKKPTNFFIAIVGIIVLIGFAIFAGAGSSFGFANFNLDQNFWSVIIFVAILGFVMWSLTKESGGEGGGEKKT